MTDTAADRPRLAEYRAITDEGALFSTATIRDLLRMAEDGIAAREALARVEALAHGWQRYDDRARMDARAVRRAITGEA